MHAVSQGALGIESRRDDMFAIKLINSLNHEDTLLRCIAERTFLAKLEGGCSAPVGVKSHVTENSIMLEGGVYDLEGTRRIQDKFEMPFSGNLLNCPVLVNAVAASESSSKLAAEVTEALSTNEVLSSSKRRLSEDHETAEFNLVQNSPLKRARSSKSEEKEEDNAAVAAEEEKTAISKSPKYYSFIIDVNIDENKMIKAELCGLHLAERLKEQGADLLINEVKAIVHKKD
jgi:hypothetical protein